MFEKLTWGKNWKCINKDPNVHIVLLDCRITKIHGDKHTLIKTIHLAKCFPIFATKMGYTLSIVQLYLKIHTMMGPLENFFGFHTFMVFKTHPLQDIASCIAWDKLVELEKMKNTR